MTSESKDDYLLKIKDRCRHAVFFDNYKSTHLIQQRTFDIGTFQGSNNGYTHQQKNGQMIGRSPARTINSH